MLPTETLRTHGRPCRLARDGATQRPATRRPGRACENASRIRAASLRLRLIVVPTAERREARGSPVPRRQVRGAIRALWITGATHHGFSGTPTHGWGIDASPAG